MIIVLQSRIKSQDFNNKKSMDSEIKERELTIINKSIIIEFHGKQKKKHPKSRLGTISKKMII